MGIDEDGSADCDGVGRADPLPDPPPSPADPPWPAPEVGTGPDGSTVREGVFGVRAGGVRSADGSAASSAPAGRCAASCPIRRGPSPPPTAVSPSGPGAPPFPSPGRAALPDGLGSAGSLTLMHPASEAASAETVTAAAVTRTSARPADEEEDAWDAAGGAAEDSVAAWDGTEGNGAAAGDDGSGDDGRE
ncbi:hypothetical protein [Streptomyces piniterrae]|nr:hypothetical protein [Streptomyces piniterrae]